jgi:hypothetical protein
MVGYAWIKARALITTLVTLTHPTGSGHPTRYVLNRHADKKVIRERTHATSQP